MGEAMESKRFCGDCGAALPPAKRFCPDCGAANDSAPTTALATTTPLPLAAPAAYAYQPAYPQQAILVDQRSTTGKTLGRMAILLVVTLFGMGLVCAKPALGIIFLMCVGIALGLRKLVK